MPKSALLLGATGLTGSHLLQHLLQSDAYNRITVLGRRSCGISHNKLREYLTSMTDLEQVSDYFQVDDVFCCLGTTLKKAGSKEAFRAIDYDIPYQAACLAKKQNVTLFSLVSSIGANANSRFFYLQVKGELEESIRALDLPSVHIFRPAGLLGNREELRFKEMVGNILARALRPVMLGPLRKSRPIEANIVAKVMLDKAISQNNGHFVWESDEIQHYFGTRKT